MINLKLSKKIFNETYLDKLTDYSHRTEVYYGGSGSGKSIWCGQKLLYKLLNDKRKLLVIRKTMTSQRESCWRLFLDMLVDWKIYGLCKINKTEFTITLPNESTILFKGMDDSEKIKSIVGITDIWVEEATELSESEFDQLNLRLRANKENQQIFVSFNPISKTNWVYKRWFSAYSTVSNDTYIKKTTYRDNRFLPEDYIKSLESMINTNPTYYKIYALGEFCSLDKLIYNNWSIQDFDYKKIQGELLVGLDFGFVNDPTALVASILANDKIYVFLEHKSINKTNPEIAKIISSLGLSKSTIIADSAEPKSIEELKRNGIYRIRESKKGPDSIIHGIQRLQQYEIIVHSNCTEIITELENYSWQKDKSGEYLNKPIDQFNHFLDALRYSLQCQDAAKLKTMSKAKLGL